MIPRAAVVVALAVFGLWLAGCVGQNETIGKGPVSLLFDNDGSSTIDVTVHWTGPQGRILSRTFDVEAYSQVDLRVAKSDRYRIELTGSSVSAAAEER